MKSGESKRSDLWGKKRCFVVVSYTAIESIAAINKNEQAN